MHVHILIASRQLWPNIFGLLLLEAQGRKPKAIHIIHSANKRESDLPAQRLEHLIKSRLAPGVSCERHKLCFESPEAVTAIIEKIASGYPPEAIKIINATGGLKAIFAGLIPFLSRRDFEVLYNEISSGWFRLRAKPSDPGRIHSETLNSPPVFASHIPVLALVETQWEQLPGASWRALAPPHIDAAELLEVMRTGFDSSWNWNRLRLAHPWLVQGGRSQPGFLFETLFATLAAPFFRELHQLARNAELVITSGQTGEKVLEEIDLVANTGRHLAIFDLKLRGQGDDPSAEISVVDQFAKVAKACDMLGGLAARGALVRPNWPRNESLQQLASAFRVELWDEEAMPTLLERLSKILGEPVPDALKSVSDLLAASPPGTRRFFSAARYFPTTPSRESVGEESEGVPGALDLSRYVQEEQNSGRPIFVKIHSGQAILVLPSHKIKYLQGNAPQKLLRFPNKTELPILHKERAAVSVTYLLSLQPGASFADLQRALNLSSPPLVREIGTPEHSEHQSAKHSRHRQNFRR